MLFKEFKKKKQEIDTDVQSKRKEIKQETQIFEQKLEMERKEFDEFISKKSATLEIITGIMKQATGMLTGNSATPYTLEELAEKAKNDTILHNDKEFMDALKQIQKGEQEEIIKGTGVMTKILTKYTLLVLDHI